MLFRSFAYGASVDQEAKEFFVANGLMGMGEVMSQARRDELQERFERGELRQAIATSIWDVGVDFTLLDVLVDSIQAPHYIPSFLGHGFGRLFHNIIWVIGLATVGFAVIERVQPELSPLGDWKPRDLPKAPAQKPMQTRLEAAFSLFFTLAAGAWVAGVVLVPETYPTMWKPQDWLARLHVGAGEVWYPTLWLLFLASCAAQAAVYLVDLLRPGGGPLRIAAKLASDAVTVAMAVVCWQAGPLFHAVDGLGDSAYGDLVAQVEFWVRIGFAISAVVAVADALWQLVRLARPARIATA